MFITGKHLSRRALLDGGRHLKAPNGTPLANVMLTLLHKLGLDNTPRFGDSEKTFELSAD